MSVITVGMAGYQESDNLWFVLDSLRLYHGWGFDIVVVDTTPGSPVKFTEDKCRSMSARYYHRPDLKGTAAPRDAVFRYSKTPWTCCIDSHVHLCSDWIKVAEWYAKKNPESVDLVQGPLIYDDHKNQSTHWQPTHPPSLTGTWDRYLVDKEGRTVRISFTGSEVIVSPSDGSNHKSYRLADLGVSNLEDAKKALGISSGTKPFEIPLQGLGQFMMRTAAWPGFHPLHRGFGGEEGYIHEKVRQNGGKALCHPGLGWTHKFRWMESGGPPPPYPLESDHHLWNLLVGHRELGIDAVESIKRQKATHMNDARFSEFLAQVEAVQEFGVRYPQRKRMKLLGIWYSNNKAPEELMAASLKSVANAHYSTAYHDVEVRTCSWGPLRSNPFPWVKAKQSFKGHAAILEQQIQCVESATTDYDAVVFLEHDVLYPADYFDRIGNAFADNPNAPVVSNLDYEGLSPDGWQTIRERHEPLHQLAMRRERFDNNVVRCKADCDKQGWCLLEPEGDRGDWVRLKVNGEMPSIHVNYGCDGQGQRFTSHGSVCYNKGKHGEHSYWGDSNARLIQMGCGCGNKSVPVASNNQPAAPEVGDPYLDAISRPSDFNEHVQFVKELADTCDHVTEVTNWHGKSTTIALGASKAKRFVSYSTGRKKAWETYEVARPNGGFEGINFGLANLISDIEETDLLLLDTLHQAQRIVDELNRYSAKVKKYVVIHCTSTPFGETGDDGGPGVMPGIRRWLKENPEWTVKFKTEKNHGLIVLSRLDEDRTPTPGVWKKALNLAKATAKHAADGMRLVSDEVHEKRLSLCMVCPERNIDACGLCGCPVATKASWASERCPKTPPEWDVESPSSVD